MAFPATTAPTATAFATSVTSMPVTMPASVASGDLLIALAHVRNSGTWTKPTGWSDISTISQAGGGAVGKLSGFYKIAAGTEGGTTPTWTASTGTTAEWQTYKVTSWHGTTPPEATTTSGDATAANPPSLTPSWGTDDTLWLAVAGHSAATTAAWSAAPTNYTGYQNDGASSGGSAVSIGSATRQLNAISEDPGAFTVSGSNRFWAAATIGVRPAGGVASQNISATAIASTATLGSPTVSPGAVTLAATAIASTLLLGSPTVSPGAVNISATGIGSTATLGSPTATSSYALSVTGVASTSALGSPTVSPGAVTITATGIAGSSALGTPTVTSLSGSQDIPATSLGSTATLGSPAATSAYTVGATGIPSASSLGVPTVSPGAVSLAPTGISSTASLGSPTLSSAYTFTVTGLPSTSSLGSPTVAPGAVTITPTGKASTATLGHPAVTGGVPSTRSASVIFLTDGRLAVRLTNNTYMPL